MTSGLKSLGAHLYEIVKQLFERSYQKVIILSNVIPLKVLSINIEMLFGYSAPRKTWELKGKMAVLCQPTYKKGFCVGVWQLNHFNTNNSAIWLHGVIGVDRHINIRCLYVSIFVKRAPVLLEFLLVVLHCICLGL